MTNVKVLIGVLILGAISLSSAHAKDSRMKVIDFEDQVVEGMNKRPLDSLNQFGDGNPDHRKPHLYRKRIGFKSETEQTLEEIGVQS